MVVEGWLIDSDIGPFNEKTKKKKKKEKQNLGNAPTMS